jgi:hypothetical protein
MPIYKYISNRFLTLFENIMIGQKLSEYRTGYRAWSRAVLEKLPLRNNSDDFVCDNQMLVQAVYFGLVKSVARPNTSRKRHRSILGVAWSTGSVC